MREVTSGNSCGLFTQGSRGGVLLMCVELWNGESSAVNGQSVSLPSHHAYCDEGSSETRFAAPRRRQLRVSALIYRPCYSFQNSLPERSHHCWSSNIMHDGESLSWIALMKTLPQQREDMLPGAIVSIDTVFHFLCRTLEKMMTYKPTLNPSCTMLSWVSKPSCRQTGAV